MYYNDVLDLIGNTPLMCLKKSTGYNIFAKAEFLNPGGSIKDRIAKNMLEVAESEGKLKPGMTIIEPTSGNTGIGLALCGVQKGYKVIIVMPENMSEERKKVIRAFGAELVLTDPILSIGGAVDKANEIAESDPEKYFMPQQFVNQANPDAHYRTTAVEMCEQLGQKIDIYVSGVGSGGTLQGIAKYLLEKNPDTKIVAVEPKGVSALHGDGPGIHQIQGIGDGFIPDVLDTSLVTDVVEVADKDAIEMAHILQSPRQLALLYVCYIVLRIAYTLGESPFSLLGSRNTDKLIQRALSKKVHIPCNQIVIAEILCTVVLKLLPAVAESLYIPPEHLRLGFLIFQLLTKLSVDKHHCDKCHSGYYSQDQHCHSVVIYAYYQPCQSCKEHHKSNP